MRVDLIDVASVYTSYTDSEAVAELIYDKNKEDIYCNLNIKTKGDFIAVLGDDKQFSLKELENANNFADELVEKHLNSLSPNELVRFIKDNYDENYNEVSA